MVTPISLKNMGGPLLGTPPGGGPLLGGAQNMGGILSILGFFIKGATSFKKRGTPPKPRLAKEQLRLITPSKLGTPPAPATRGLWGCRGGI